MVRSLLVGLLLIVCLSLVVASAGSLEVDGGTIQVFEYTVEVPGVKGGTSLEAYKTAAGFWQQGEGGGRAGVSGEVCVTNSGERPTQGLSITDVVETHQGKGGFKSYLSQAIDVSMKPVLAPGESYCYPYMIEFEPLSGARYRNTAQVKITNHSGWLPGSNHCPGPDPCPFGPSPKAGFDLPSPSLPKLAPHRGRACVLPRAYWLEHPEAWPVMEFELGEETLGRKQALVLLHLETGEDYGEYWQEEAGLKLLQAWIVAELNLQNGAYQPEVFELAAEVQTWFADHPLSVNLSVEEAEWAQDQYRRLKRFSEGKDELPLCPEWEPTAIASPTLTASQTPTLVATPTATPTATLTAPSAPTATPTPSSTPPATETAPPQDEAPEPSPTPTAFAPVVPSSPEPLPPTSSTPPTAEPSATEEPTAEPPPAEAPLPEPPPTEEPTAEPAPAEEPPPPEEPSPTPGPEQTEP